MIQNSLHFNLCSRSYLKLISHPGLYVGEYLYWGIPFSAKSALCGSIMLLHDGIPRIFHHEYIICEIQRQLYDNMFSIPGTEERIMGIDLCRRCTNDKQKVPI